MAVGLISNYIFCENVPRAVNVVTSRARCHVISVARQMHSPLNRLKNKVYVISAKCTNYSNKYLIDIQIDSFQAGRGNYVLIMCVNRRMPTHQSLSPRLTK